MADTETSSTALQLVKKYLNQHGFDLTSKAFSKELTSKKLAPTASTVIEHNGAGLDAILTMWEKDNIKRTEQSSTFNVDNVGSSSETDASEAESDTNSTSTSSLSNSSHDVGSARSDASTSKVAAIGSAPPKSVGRHSERPSATSSSTSESDANYEDERPAKVKTTKISRSERTLGSSPKATLLPTSLSQKRKRAESSSESSSSASGSDSESTSANEQPARKRVKSTGGAASIEPTDSSASSSSSSESGTSDSESSSDEAASVDDLPSATQANKDQTRDDGSAVDSSSSSTVVGDGASSLKPALISSSGKSANTMLEKRRHVGAQPTPLASLSAKATPDSHISNAYQSYDYADRAYGDLSATRGKGFTKEKNKKKRGSYRGGTIDISGGKAFKFED